MPECEYQPTYCGVLTRNARDFGGQPALTFDDRTITHAELNRRATRIANGLMAMGLSKGDRVTYLGKNSDISVELLAGCARAGMIFIPIIWRLSPVEVAGILEDAEAGALFIEPQFNAIEWDGQRVIMDASFDAWRDAQADTPVAMQVDADDVMLQLYTSGTTGKPKGVMLTHHNGTWMRPRLKEENIYWYAAEPGDGLIHAMPYGHIGGAGAVLNGLNGANHLIVHAEFDPGLMLRDIERYRAKWLFIVPAALRYLLAHPDAATTDFSSMRVMTYGASPIPLDLLKQAVERIGCEFAQLYGLTETWGTVVSLPPADHLPGREDKMRAAGLPLPDVEIAIFDAEGNPLPNGEVGEIAIRCPSVMKGYWNRPEETARAVRDDGWFLTGDAGIVDDEGYVFIQDRIKDMIVSGAENVYPAEVESAIFGHPDIADIAVIGVPDDKWGEAVKAIVVRRPGSELDENAVIEWARSRIAGFKCPKSVDFIDALPRNQTLNKILKYKLREQYG